MSVAAPNSFAASSVVTRTQKAVRWAAFAATKGVVKMKQTVGSTGRTSRSPQVAPKKMTQQELPFWEDFKPGWKGKRYLLCTDGVWHLILEIHQGLMADSQCCSDTTVLLPVPTLDAGSPMCPDCVSLQFPSAAK